MAVMRTSKGVRDELRWMSMVALAKAVEKEYFGDSRGLEGEFNRLMDAQLGGQVLLDKGGTSVQESAHG